MIRSREYAEADPASVRSALEFASSHAANFACNKRVNASMGIDLWVDVNIPV